MSTEPESTRSAEDVIAKQIRECQQAEGYWASEEAVLILDALAAAGYAVVQLPKPDDVGSGQDGEFDAWWGHYPDNDPGNPPLWPNHDITAEQGRCGYGIGGQFTPGEARLFAAALLAAAGVAESLSLPVPREEPNP